MTNKMNSDRRNAIIVGILILVAYSMLASEVTDIKWVAALFAFNFDETNLRLFAFICGLFSSYPYNQQILFLEPLLYFQVTHKSTFFRSLAQDIKIWDFLHLVDTASNWAVQQTARKTVEREVRRFVRRYVIRHGLKIEELDNLYQNLMENVENYGKASWNQ